MLAFPKVCIVVRSYRGSSSHFLQLHDVYHAWKIEIASRGNVTFELGHEVVAVVSRSSKGKASDSSPVDIKYKISRDDLETNFQVAAFDELILAVDADTALKLLGNNATWMEKKVLGNVKYLHDVTITHNDLDYMNKVCRLFFARPIMVMYQHALNCSIMRHVTIRRIMHLCPEAVPRSMNKERRSPSHRNNFAPCTTPCNILETNLKLR